MNFFMPRFKFSARFMTIVALAAVIGASQSWAAGADIGPLPGMKFDAAKAALGKRLFFDQRLSGDAAISCGTCHDPKEGFTKHVALGEAYPGSKHFRNAPTLINTAYKKQYGIPWHWDGRIGTSLNDMTRDQIVDTYVLNMDMRIMQERQKQDMVSVKMFKDAGWNEPSNGRVRKAIPHFIKTLVSTNVPFDKGKMSSKAKKGMKLFKGKAGCINCHNGPMFSDGKPHNTGVPENPCLFKDPLRHVTYLTFMFGMGTENRYNWRRDVGHFIVTHNEKDIGSFVTPTLRELKYTAPYMHNGMISSLDKVIDFYNKGGGPDRNYRSINPCNVATMKPLKDPLMKPLKLSSSEKSALKEFLLALSGDPSKVEAIKVDLSYKPIEDWYNKKN